MLVGGLQLGFRLGKAPLEMSDRGVDEAVLVCFGTLIDTARSRGETVKVD